MHLLSQLVMKQHSFPESSVHSYYCFTPLEKSQKEFNFYLLLS